MYGSSVGGSNSQSAPVGANAIVQTSPLPGERQRPRRGALVLVGPETDRDVVRACDQESLRGEIAPFAGQSDRGQRALADDHRVDELDRDMARIGASGRRATEGDQPAAPGEALGHQVA